MDPIVFVLIGLAIAAGIAIKYYLDHKRREEWRKVSRLMGFEFTEHDPFGLLGLPFALFRKGDGRGIENVAWGEHKGKRTTVFEYWYYEESTDSEGQTSRSYEHFTCGFIALPQPLPGIDIEPEGLFSRLKDHVGFRDIEFESEEFNRAFEVQARDRRFATYLCDARMMQWLLWAKDGWHFAISDVYLLCYSRRLRPMQVMQLAVALHGFHEKIPDVVWDVYS